MKKILAFCFSLVLLCLVVVAPAFAETSQRPVLEKVRTGSTAATRAQVQQKIDARSDNLKQRAVNEINRRIDALQKLLTRISEFKKISASEKASLTTQVQSQIDSLTSLLTKINADTDAATLKTDVKSIVTSYRVFALFIPQVQILGAGDRVLTIADEMSSHAATLETKIADAKTKGKNVATLETLLSDMKAKIADAKLQAQHAIDTVSPLTPAGFPGNKTTLQSARQMIEVALKDLSTARQDGRKIILGLLKLGPIPTPRVSISVTPGVRCAPRPPCPDSKLTCQMPQSQTLLPWCPEKKVITTTPIPLPSATTNQ